MASLHDGRYELVKVIGQGGHAVVYEVLDTRLGVPRAIKLLRPEVTGERRAELVRRLRGEARAMAQISHPNIVAVHDVVTDDTLAFVVMDLCTAGTLEWLLRSGPVHPRLCAEFGVQLLSALSAAHAHRIVHRDIKPSNVLLGDDGAVRLADFGIAALGNEEELRATRKGVSLGTVPYMAPEQRVDARSVTPSADLHAVGALLYNLATGQSPLDLFQVTADHPRLAGVAPPLAQVIERATRYLPEQRYGSAAEMAAALADILESLGPRPESVSLVAPDDRKLARRPMWTPSDTAVAAATSGILQATMPVARPGPDWVWWTAGAGVVLGLGAIAFVLLS